MLALAAEEEKLLGVTLFPCRGKSKGRSLQERCPRSSICGRSGLARHLCVFASAATAASGSAPELQGSGSLVPAEVCWGWQGPSLHAGQLCSHHFNKEMIKMGWGKKNPKHLFYFKSEKIPLLARNV